MAKYSFTTYGIPKYGEIENNRVFYNVSLRAWSYDYNSVSLVWTSVVSDPADSIVASILSYSVTNNVATMMTQGDHNFIQNLPVIIGGVSEQLNGSYVIASIPSSNTFTIAVNAPDTNGTAILMTPGSATVGRPTHWKLIKSFSGAPNNPYDGIFVDGDVISSYRLSKIDEQEVLEPTEVNYSFWIFNGQKWVECGNVDTIIIPETDTASKISKWIPRAWLNEVGGIGDGSGEPEDGDLTKVLSAYAFEYDRLRAEADLLFKSSDYRYLPNVLLKNRITDLGFNYEPALGDLYHRALYKSGHIINGVKGTKTAVQNYTTSLTHWPTTVSIGHNLMLDYNDSSFEESLGRWGKTLNEGLGGSNLVSISQSTLTQRKYSTSQADLGFVLTPPTPTVYDVLFPPRSVGYMHLAGVGATFDINTYLRLPSIQTGESALTSTAGREIKYGIPVTPGKRYIFSGWVRSKNARPTSGAQYLFPVTNYTVWAQMEFYDKNNNYISSGNSGLVRTWFTNTWKEVVTGYYENSELKTDRQGATAPANAAYAAVVIYAATDYVLGDLYFDMFQFSEAGVKSLEFQDARRVQVTVNGVKENFLPNPSFNSGTAGWHELNSNLMQDFNPPTTALVHGLSVAKLTATSEDRVALVSDWIPVDPGQNYTFSIYASGAARKVRARIEYSTQQSADEQNRIITDEYGSYYVVEPYKVDSAEVTLTATAQRIHVSSVAPAYTQDSGYPLAKVSIYTDEAEIGDSFYFDAAMLEETSSLDAFFDGSGAPSPSNPITETFFDPLDCLWETRSRYNFVSNPSLDSTNDWTAGSGTTLTSAYETPPIYGSKHGKVSKPGGGSVSTTVYLPKAAVGGEDVTISAYVRNKAGVYSISTNGQAVGLHTVEEANKDQWIRIHTDRVLLPGETSFTLTISLSTGNGAAAVFYLDGVQAEYGRTVTRFIDPADAGTSTIPNLLNPSVNMYGSRLESIGGGLSYYWPTYSDKFTRLASTLNLVMPYGSSWAIQPGEIRPDYPDLDASLIPSASFEGDLGQWQGINANLTRTVVRGTLFDEYCTHGTAYCRVQSSSAAVFGIQTSEISINGGSGYYASIAVKPENVDSFGEYQLTVTYYDDFDLQVHQVSNSVSIDREDRWFYLAAIATAAETGGATYAKLKVQCTPYSLNAGQTFHLDRVVFRE